MHCEKRCWTATARSSTVNLWRTPLQLYYAGSRIEERRREGFITWRDFRLYLDAFGRRGKVILLLLLALSGCGLERGANVGCPTGPTAVARSKQLRGLVIYVLIGGVQAVVLALQTIILTLCALNDSKHYIVKC